MKESLCSSCGAVAHGLKQFWQTPWELQCHIWKKVCINAHKNVCYVQINLQFYLYANSVKTIRLSTIKFFFQFTCITVIVSLRVLDFLTEAEHATDLENQVIFTSRSRFAIFTCKHIARLYFTGLMIVFKSLSEASKEAISEVNCMKNTSCFHRICA